MQMTQRALLQGSTGGGQSVVPGRLTHALHVKHRRVACCTWRKPKGKAQRALQQQAKPSSKADKAAKQAANKPRQLLQRLVGVASPDKRAKQSSGLQKRSKAKPDSQPKWRLFDLKAYQSIEPWSIPWGWRTTIGGTAAWAVAFVLIGILQIPIAIYGFNAPNMAKLTALQQSQIMLIDQVLSTIVSVGLVRSIAKKWDTPGDFLSISLQRPFAKPDGWAAWGLAGLATAPPSILAANFMFELLPVTAARGSGTVGAVSDMVGSVEPLVFLNLLLVTGVLAPVLEETVFRGFLLPSLTTKMSVPAAVVASSALFAVCHASLRDLPSLFALGVVMGFAYCRSRNLMTSIAIHGAWNSFTIVVLYVLVSSGVPLDEILAT